MSGREQHDNFPSLVEACFLVVILFALEFVVSAAFRDAARVGGLKARDFNEIVTLLANGALFTGLLYYKRLSYGELFHPARHSVAATLGTLSVPILLVVPGLLLVTSCMNAVVVWAFPLSRWEEAMFERMMSSGLASVVATCILAPVLEEMLFRGIILRSFLHQYPRNRAILCSAALFGAAHMNIYQFFVALVLGSVLGWLYERARSLWPCILLHSAYNGVITYLFFADASARQEGYSDGSLWWWVAAAICGLTGTTALRRLLKPA